MANISINFLKLILICYWNLSEGHKTISICEYRI